MGCELELSRGLLWVSVARLPIRGYSRGMSNAPHHLSRTVHRVCTGALGLGVAVSVAVGHVNDVPPTVTMDQAPHMPVQVEPQWTAAHGATFPGCVASDTARGFIPARVVVVPRTGAAHAVPYTEATAARIRATWDDQSPANDLFTIGACR